MPVPIIDLPELAERFFKFVDKDGPIHPVYGKCWIWTRPCESSKYANFSYKGLNFSVHRWAWLISRGSLAKLFVCHKCDNTKCVNPDHLFEGTHRDNTDDMMAKGRQRFGEHSIQSKLTDIQVLDMLIKLAEGKSRRELAKEYGISSHYVTQLKCKRARKYLWVSNG